ncbi:Hypothetical predicted protein [Cloeon dipterum]|uniref:F-box domain-containing protein n=1 Tax=Cloeon dipterum TaxID=197152 RepID=A0A8S1E4W1_9INSE|nr:Hypothetical predicted protein [Cloeon dipterum]
MDEETLLKMTKTRPSKLRMQDSNFLKLTLTSIVKNYTFYAQNDIKEQNLQNLPNSLRNKVLEELSNHWKCEDLQINYGEFDLRVALFRRLINSQTLKVDLASCMLNCNPMHNLNNSLFEKLLNVLENATNLEELTFGESCNVQYTSSVTKEWSSKLSQLCKLRSLKLTALWFDEIDHLLSVCRHMPNLKVMWVSVCKIPEGHEPNLQYLDSCFPSLIVYFIRVCTRVHRPSLKKLEIVLDELCCRNAQKLQIFYDEFRHESNVHMVYNFLAF